MILLMRLFVFVDCDNNMTKLIIIRHCETVDNAKGLLQGYHNDSEFSEQGKKQIAKLIAHLNSEKIKEVYCSDLGRAHKTAQAIADSHSVSCTPLNDLRECNSGDWQNIPVKELIQRWDDLYATKLAEGLKREDIRPPNGENTFDHEKRVMRVIRNAVVKHPDETIVVVGHSGTNKVILGSLRKLDSDDYYKQKQNNACVNIVAVDGDNVNIVVLNDTSFLQ